ncbi:uncharacterized protein [Paramormyrops kingsleyae]|uniref:uncharacterized protein n=1 Tax=Paramormyrops kingsleyae TaxID=1676925 RepID=UPI003B97235F
MSTTMDINEWVGSQEDIKNTSSMLRHFRAKHENVQNIPSTSQSTRSLETKKQKIDEALINMIVKDSQPFSIVDDAGFREFEAQQNPSTSTYTQPPEPEPAGTSSGLWDLLDSDVGESRQIKSSTADATVEVQQYLSDPNITHTEDPLRFWDMQQAVYPHLYELAVQFLCTPASSVPCEWVFSKAGEVMNKKRNQLSPRTVEQILFLNKNL